MYRRKFLMCSILKSLYYSIKYRCFFLVGRGARIILEGNAKLVISRLSKIEVGLEYYAPSRGTVLRVATGAVCCLGDRVSLKNSVYISVNTGAVLSIGEDTFINEYTKLFVYKEVSIGKQSAISYGVTITDSDIHEFEGTDCTAPVIIGKRVWLCAECMVLRGSEIGDGTVVAARSVVRSRFSGESLLLVGVPAKIHKKNISWYK